jgi:hypothetical protein
VNVAPYVPPTEAVTVQVYVTKEEAMGPVVDVQAVTPLTPVIKQVPLPVGNAAFVGGATVAVNTKVEPSVAVVAFGISVSVGLPWLTVVVATEEVAPTEV